MKILKFSEYKLNENTELQWNMVGGNPGIPGANPIMQHVDDHNLSVDGYDRFVLNQKSMVDRLNHMMGYLFGKNNVSLEFGAEDLEGIKSLKILRMHRNESGTLDIFISFVIEEEEYYGVFWGYGGQMKPEFVSEIQRLPALQFAKDKYARLQGWILKTIEKWFEDLDGSYRLLADQLSAYDNMGKEYVLKKGCNVLYLDSNIDSNYQFIKVRVKINRKEVKELKIKGLNVFFFKYMFEPIDLFEEMEE